MRCTRSLAAALRPRTSLPSGSAPRLVLAVVLVSLVVGSAVATAPGASAAVEPRRAPPPASPYRPPLDRPVIDPFRAPAHPYGPGNRGLEYDSVPGDVVRAIGAGTVTFAGSVGGQRFVTVTHPDGLRSTSAFLATISVHFGQRVVRGDPLGTTGERFHLGVRRGDRYIDPASLFGGRRRIVLVGPYEQTRRESTRREPTRRISARRR